MSCLDLWPENRINENLNHTLLRKKGCFLYELDTRDIEIIIHVVVIRVVGYGIVVLVELGTLWACFHSDLDSRQLLKILTGSCLQ